MMKTTGHSSTPAVKLSEPDWPNSFHSNGAMPSVVSSAKILTPMNSAISALQTKIPVSTTKSFCARGESWNGMVSLAKRGSVAVGGRRGFDQPIGDDGFGGSGSPLGEGAAPAVSIGFSKRNFSGAIA